MSAYSLFSLPVTGKFHPLKRHCLNAKDLWGEIEVVLLVLVDSPLISYMVNEMLANRGTAEGIQFIFGLFLSLQVTFISTEFQICVCLLMKTVTRPIGVKSRKKFWSARLQCIGTISPSPLISYMVNEMLANSFNPLSSMNLLIRLSCYSKQIWVSFRVPSTAERIPILLFFLSDYCKFWSRGN